MHAKFHHHNSKALHFLWLVLILLGINNAWSQNNSLTPFETQTTNGFQAQPNNEFLNVEDAYQLNIDFQDTDDSEKKQPVLIWQAQEGYYLYKHGFKQYAQDSHQVTPEIQITGDIPAGKLTVDEYFGEVETYYNQVIIPLDIESSAEALYIRAQSQGCADAGLCYPPYDIYAKVNLHDYTVETVTQSDYLANSTLTTPSHSPSSEPLETTLVIAIIGAFLGGLILNLMPCVLPVLSIKLLQIQQAGRHAKLHGMAYMGGVMLSFLTIAIVLIALRNAGQAVGWGFQLQQPWVITLLIGLFFTLALSLSGYFELGSRLMGLGQNRGSTQPGSNNKPSSAFITGILAVIVATPCTAPFMGTALGFALTQSNTEALCIFASLGFGMALPLTAITFIPSLHSVMPKPGMWMVRLKEFFAFPLYMTCVWLLWVLANQTSTTALAFVLLGLVAICFTIWCFKTQIFGFKVLGVAALAGLLSLFTTDVLTPQTQDSHHQHLAYSPKALEELREQGTPVFIDLTADWCITCIANEKSTLEKPEVQQAFNDANIVYMVGDWTNYDPDITALIEQHQRSGIPLYLLYPPRPNAPATILPQLLSPSTVLEAIRNNQ